ncbi:sulfur oxidation c-type cytochrome SoxX [Candidatus Falkowbacteria bacterium]|nr:sulfur oxidation c-type cytochrome SoxX [Candidatus Falkowbacteria bacterium]
MLRHAVFAACAVTVLAGQTWAEIAPADIVWQEGAIAQPLADQPGDPESGKKIMTTNALGNCVACHLIGTMPDVQFQGNIGPALDGAAGRYTEAQLRGIVVDSKKTFEGTEMPAMYKTSGFIRPGNAYTGKAAPADLPPILSAQQIEDVVAYLLTLKE